MTEPVSQRMSTPTITLAQFAADYRCSDTWARETIHLNYYATLSFSEGVAAAGRATYFSRDLTAGGVIVPKQHPHIRMWRGNADRCSEALLARLSDVAAAAHEGFEPLRRLVQEITSRVPVLGDGDGPGPLYWLDAAEAIGMAGGRGLRPGKVYLAGNGPRGCARLLGIAGHSTRPWLDVSELPACFHHLEPWEVETCLCAVENLHRRGLLRMKAGE